MPSRCRSHGVVVEGGGALGARPAPPAGGAGGAPVVGIGTRRIGGAGQGTVESGGWSGPSRSAVVSRTLRAATSDTRPGASASASIRSTMTATIAPPTRGR